MGKPHLEGCKSKATLVRTLASQSFLNPLRKIYVKRNLPIGRVPVFTLIRTDTTLDLSQKAEKV